MLSPLSLRDLIWLKACRKILYDTGHEKEMLFLLYDLREIAFAFLGYTSDQKQEKENAYYSLPSMREYNITPPPKKHGKGGRIRNANAYEKQQIEETKARLAAARKTGARDSEIARWARTPD